MIITLFGQNFHAGDPVSGNSLPLPLRLGDLGTRVIVNGSIECPLFFVSEGQINILVPDDAPVGCALPVRVETHDGLGHIGTVAVSTDGMHCRGPVEDIVTGLSHGSIVLASGLGRLGPGQLGPTRGHL